MKWAQRTPEAHRLDSARVGIRPNRPSLLSRGKPKPTQHQPEKPHCSIVGLPGVAETVWASKTILVPFPSGPETPGWAQPSRREAKPGSAVFVGSGGGLCAPELR